MTARRVGAQRLLSRKVDGDARRFRPTSLSTAYVVAGAGLAVATVISYDKRGEYTE